MSATFGAWALLGVDLVKNRETKEPLNTKADKMAGKPLVVDQVAADMMKGGVAVQPWISHIVLAPPLIIEKDDLDLGVAMLDNALRIADRRVEA